MELDKCRFSGPCLKYSVGLNCFSFTSDSDADGAQTPLEKQTVSMWCPREVLGHFDKWEPPKEADKQCGLYAAGDNKSTTQMSRKLHPFL